MGCYTITFMFKNTSNVQMKFYTCLVTLCTSENKLTVNNI